MSRAIGRRLAIGDNYPDDNYPNDNYPKDDEGERQMNCVGDRQE